MERQKRVGLTMLGVLAGLAGLMGCGRIINGLADSPPIAPSPAPTPSPDWVETAPPAAATPQTDYFREATNRATSAVVIGQSAQSQADWQLAVGRWQQAIALMQRVPADSPNYAQAQTKVKEYQQSLVAAQQRAEDQPAIAATDPAPVAPNGLVAQIPIQERRGGIPVVEVTLQGQRGRHRFPMMFDTGASGTLITAEMAEQIGVVVVGRTQAKVADGSTVELPIGYVDELEVGGLRKTAMLVAIGGSVGLLGQDVYGEFGIAVGSTMINLHQ
jgi:predicted aspartyl protease